MAKRAEEKTQVNMPRVYTEIHLNVRRQNTDKHVPKSTTQEHISAFCVHQYTYTHSHTDANTHEHIEYYKHTHSEKCFEKKKRFKKSLPKLQVTEKSQKIIDQSTN